MTTTWHVLLKDGSRHPISGDIHFDVVHGTKRIAPSSIQGDADALVKAFEENEVVLESPHHHRHKASVEMISGQWRVVGL